MIKAVKDDTETSDLIQWKECLDQRLTPHACTRGKVIVVVVVVIVYTEV